MANNTQPVFNMEEGYSAYQCSKCGHYVGDSVDTGSCIWKCPGCNRMSTFYQVTADE